MTKYTLEYIAQRRAQMEADARHDNEASFITLEEFY